MARTGRLQMEVRLDGQEITKSVQWPVSFTNEVGARSLSSVTVWLPEYLRDHRMRFDDGSFVEFGDKSVIEFDDESIAKIAQFGDGSQIAFDDGTLLDFDEPYNVADFDRFLRELVADIPALPYRPHAVANGATHYWPLDERSQPAAMDIVGNVRSMVFADGAVSYREWKGEAAGVPQGGAVAFTNSAAGGFGATAPNMAIPAGEWEAGAYFRRMGAWTGRRELIRVGSARIEATSTNLYLIDSRGRQVSHTFTMPSDEWSHVSMRQDGGAIHLMLNGDLLTSSNGAGAFPARVSVRLGGCLTGAPVNLGVDEASIGSAGHMDVSRSRHMRAFGGYIYQPDNTKPRGHNQQGLFTLSLVGYAYHLRKNFVDKTYALSGRVRVADLCERILEDLGLSSRYTTDGVSVDDYVERFQGEGATVEAAFTKLARLFNSYSFVDQWRGLTFDRQDVPGYTDLVLDKTNVVSLKRSVIPRRFANSVRVETMGVEVERARKFAGDDTTRLFELPFKPSRILRVVVDGLDVDAEGWLFDRDYGYVELVDPPKKGSELTIVFLSTGPEHATSDDSESIAEFGRVEYRARSGVASFRDARILSESELEASKLSHRYTIVTIPKTIRRAINSGTNPLVNLPTRGVDGRRLIVQRVDTSVNKGDREQHVIVATDGRAREVSTDFWRRKTEDDILSGTIERRRGSGGLFALDDSLLDGPEVLG